MRGWGGHWRKLTSAREGSRYKNYDAASRTILELASACFQRSNYKLCICFSLATIRQTKNFKTIRAFARARKYEFNFRGLKKINLSSDPIPLKGRKI
jgi:hypothetical protein